MLKKIFFSLLFLCVCTNAYLSDYNYLLDQNKVGENQFYFGYYCNVWQDIHPLTQGGIPAEYWTAYSYTRNSQNAFYTAKAYSDNQKWAAYFGYGMLWQAYGMLCKNAQALALNNAIEAGKTAMQVTSDKQKQLKESLDPQYEGTAVGALELLNEEEQLIKDRLSNTQLSKKFLNATNAVKIARNDFRNDENIFYAIKSVNEDNRLLAQLLQTGSQIDEVFVLIQAENEATQQAYQLKESEAMRHQTILDSLQIELIDEDSFTLLNRNPSRLITGSTASFMELYYKHAYSVNLAKESAKQAQNKLNSKQKDAFTGSTHKYSQAIGKLGEAEKIFGDLTLRIKDFVDALENQTIVKIIDTQKQIASTISKNPSAAADANEDVNKAIDLINSINAESVGKKTQKLRAALLLLDKAKKTLEQTPDVAESAFDAQSQLDKARKLLEEAKNNGFSEELIELENQLNQLRDFLAKTSATNENRKTFDYIYEKALQIQEKIKLIAAGYDSQITELVKKVSQVQSVLTPQEQQTLLKIISDTQDIGGKKTALNELNKIWSRILSQSKQLIANELEQNVFYSSIPQKIVLGQAIELVKNYWTKNTLPLEYFGEINFNAKLDSAEQLVNKSSNVAGINSINGKVTAIESSQGEEYSFSTKQSTVVATKTGEQTKAIAVESKVVVSKTISFDSLVDWPVTLSIDIPKNAVIKTISQVIDQQRQTDELIVTVPAKKGKNEFFIEYELPIEINEAVTQSNGQTIIELTVVPPVDLKEFSATYFVETPFAQKKVQSNGFFQTEIKQQENIASVTLSGSDLRKGMEYRQTILVEGLPSTSVILLTNKSLDEQTILDPRAYEWQLAAGLQNELQSLADQENFADISSQLKKSLSLMQADDLQGAEKELANAEKTVNLILANRIDELKTLAKQTSDSSGALAYVNSVEANALEKALNNKYVEAFNAVFNAKKVLESKILEYGQQNDLKQIIITNVSESKNFIQSQLDAYQKAFSNSDATTATQVAQKTKQVTDLVKEFEKTTINSADASIVSAKKNELNKLVNQISSDTESIKNNASIVLNKTKQKIDELGGFSDLSEFENAKKLFDQGQYTQAIKQAQEISDRLTPLPFTAQVVAADNTQAYLGVAGGIILLTLGAVFLRKKQTNGFEQV